MTGEAAFIWGGRIAEVNGQPRGPLVHINADGTVDPWAPQVTLLGFPATVHALVVRDDAIFVLGDFAMPTTAGANLVAFTRDGQRLDWNPRIEGSVVTLAEEDGILYVLGSFTTIDGHPRAGFATFDEQRRLMDMQVTLTRDESTLAYAAGRLYTVTTTSPGIASLHARDVQTGATEWSVAFTTKPETDDQTQIRAVRVGAATGSIYVLGSFDLVDGTPQSNIVALEPDGRMRPQQIDLTYEYVNAQGQAIEQPGWAETVVEHNDTIYVGGIFDRAEGTIRHNVAAYALDGSLSIWGPSVDRGVYDLVPNDDRVYLAGAFESVSSGRRHRLAALRPDGTLSDWQPTVAGVVHALTWKDGRLFVGGNFSGIDGAPRSNVAAFDADGQLLAWAPQVECSCESGRRGVVFPAVANIEIVDDTVYLAGAFDAIDGQPRSALAAIGLDGSLLPLSIQLEGPFKPTIYDFALDDSVIYLGGDFEGINGEPRPYLAAVNLEGDLGTWRSDRSTEVRALLVHEGVIYAGGPSGLATIDSRGQPSAGCSNLTSVYAVARHDGWIVAGGVPPQGRSLSLCEAGSDAPPSDPGPVFWAPWTSTVKTIVTTDYGLYLGGDFQRVDGRPQGGFAFIPIDGS